MIHSHNTKAADTISNCIHANLVAVKEELKQYFPMIHRKILSTQEFLDLRYVFRARNYESVYQSLEILNIFPSAVTDISVQVTKNKKYEVHFEADRSMITEQHLKLINQCNPNHFP